MRVLVTGGGGLLGGRLASLLAERGFEVLVTRRRTAPPPGLRSVNVDLTEPGALDTLLDREKPDGVVHAAVLGRTDECERQAKLAEAVNARLPGRLAAACRSRRIRVIGLSTDLVLSGDRALSDEAAPAAPLGVYGRTKLAGEEALLSGDPDSAVVRVALVVGRGHGARPSASESVAWALGQGRPVRLFADEFRTPVDAVSVAQALGRLLEAGGAGRYHLGGPERLSRLELGHRVARVLELPAEPIQAGFQADYPGPDPRAADTSLDSRRARRELRFTPRPLDEALRDSRLRPDPQPAAS